MNTFSYDICQNEKCHLIYFKTNLGLKSNNTQSIASFMNENYS